MAKENQGKPVNGGSPGEMTNKMVVTKIRCLRRIYR